MERDSVYCEATGHSYTHFRSDVPVSSYTAASLAAQLDGVCVCVCGGVCGGVCVRGGGHWLKVSSVSMVSSPLKGAPTMIDR